MVAGDERQRGRCSALRRDHDPACGRATLSAETQNIWPRACPGVPLYTELLARYGKSHLDMLDDELAPSE